jgi:hypothetical protein
MDNLVNLQGFIDEWKNQTKLIEKGNLTHFIDSFSSMKAKYHSYKLEHELIEITEAPGFNIFQILGVQYDEVKQSTFMANLLDPQGNHGQGSLFLNTFLNYCVKSHPDFPILPVSADQGRWFVETEHYITNGRLDILLVNWDLGCLFVIENKIYATEQNQQIARYWTWMEKHRDICHTMGLISDG